MPAPISVTVFGVTYPSLSAAARAFGIKPNTLHNRICASRGICAELEVVFVIKKSTSHKITPSFIGLNNKAYYTVNWNEKPVTTRQIIEHYRQDLLEAYDASNPTGEYKPFIRKRGEL